MGLLPRNKRSPRRVPAPSGPYSVGCTDVMTPGLENGVFFRLYYPAVTVKDPISPDWLPHESYLKGYAMFFKIWPPLYCKYFPKFVGDIEIPACWDAPPLKPPVGHSFPVIVFSHGLGGCRTSYTTFCLEMASQGYVVAALEHRDYSACMTFYFEDVTQSEAASNEVDQNGKRPEVRRLKKWMLFKKVKSRKGEYAIRNQQVYRRGKECNLALDALRDISQGIRITNLMESCHLQLDSFCGLLDTNLATVAGHSFGGASVITALAKDSRFSTGLGLDAWMFPLREEPSIFQSIHQPMLFVNMEKFQTKSNLKVMKKLQSSRTTRTVITLKGTVHLNQCDVPFLCDKTMRRLFGAHSRLDRFTAMNLTTTLSNVFLCKHNNMYIEKKHEAYIGQYKEVLKEGIHVA